MTTDNDPTKVIDTADKTVEGIKKDIEKEQTQWQKTWGKTKELASNLAFWKKDLTEEEKMEKAMQKVVKCLQEHDAAEAKAEKEKDKAKAEKILKKADEKYLKRMKELEEKYPEQMKKINNGEVKIPEYGPKKSLWEKILFWKKDKTDEEKMAKVKKEIEKIDNKYKKDMDKANKEKDAKKAAEKRKEAEKKQAESSQKLAEKYPEQISQVVREEIGEAIKKYDQAIAQANQEKDEKKAANMRKEAEKKQEAAFIELYKKYPKQYGQFVKEAEEIEKKAQEEARKKAAEEKAKEAEADPKKKEEEKTKEKAELAAGEQKLVIDDASLIPNADKTQGQFEKRVKSKAAVKAAKGRVSQTPEERKTATLKKWMKEVNLPEDKATAMIEKYGIDVAYRLTQRCMLEPDNLMPEVDEKFKKVQNKSKASINYFLELDVDNNANRNTVSKVTDIEFTKGAKADNAATQNQGAENSALAAKQVTR